VTPRAIVKTGCGGGGDGVPLGAHVLQHRSHRAMVVG